MFVNHKGGGALGCFVFGFRGSGALGGSVVVGFAPWGVAAEDMA